MPSLRTNQRIAADNLILQSKLLLADVGAGKTATVLSALKKRQLLFGHKRTLVLGTKRICESVWGNEIFIWAPELHFDHVAGKPTAERMAIMSDLSLDVVALNFDNLIWAVKTYGPYLTQLFPQLVIDESSKLENPHSVSFKTFKPLLPLFEWRLPMTGTPRANHLYDLWGSVYLADLGESLGKYREAFLQKWFRPVMRAHGQDWLPRPHAEHEIFARLQDIVHRMPFEWQKPVEIDWLIPLASSVEKILAQIDDQLEESDTAIINGTTYARNGFRINAKLMQLASGSVYNNEGEVIHYHSDKLEALAELTKEAKGEPMMVIFQFDHERDAILKAFPQAKLLTDEKVLAEWNAGKIEILLAHPLSCGHGLNAQLSQCALQVWYSPTTDAELYTQTVGRLNRPGNKNTVRVIRLIMKGTKDLAAYMVVAARQKGEAATLDMFEEL